MKKCTPLRFLALFFPALAFLSGCAETELASHYIKKLYSRPSSEVSGTYKVGNPYQVGSVWYYPEENFRYVETGIASWYGPDFHGHSTANGETYDQNDLTAAHRTLQMPCFARVTNLENGRSVVVRVNDRGPFLHGRVVDVSKRAATLLGFIGRGTARVRLEVLEKESRQIAEAARRGVDTSNMSLADLRQIQPSASTRSAQAYKPGRDAEIVPESLKTPTITVEELNRTDAFSPVAAPAAYVPPASVSAPASVPTHVSHGRTVPDPVVSHEPVRPTGIFVQAGSFGVRANAEKLARRLSSIARTDIEPVAVNGRTFYRVRLGPLSSVSAADAVLEKAIRAGSGAGHVVKIK